MEDPPVASAALRTSAEPRAHAASVECRNVEKWFGELNVLADVDFAIPAGSFVSVLGPSGCGKTTLLHLAVGLLEPTEGEIAVLAPQFMPRRHNRFDYTKAVDGSDPFMNILYPAQDPAPGPLFVSAEGDKSPTPSPSGTRMAFTNSTSGRPKIYVATVTGDSRRFVTNGYQPDWQPVP